MSASPIITDEKLAFIEEMGRFMEGYGFARVGGRVLGALLVAEPAEQTADDLRTTLRASRSSISVALRTLENVGFIERVTRLGDRKSYFRNRPDAWTELTKRQLEATTAMKRMAERGLEILETDDPAARLGLEEMRDFYAFFEREHPKIVADWLAELARRRGRDDAVASEEDDDA